MDGLDWLYARQQMGIKLGLDKVRRLLAELGNPHDGIRFIHVAGTNGKGSVTRMLGDVLRRAGHSVGVTTSPHLVRFNERIHINGADVTDEDVARWLAQMRPIVERLDEHGDSPTFFELVTAMAFLAFRDAGVAWAVIETGLGGRLDATNVVEPVLTIITNVGMDHTAFLGPDVASIAREKAGIMKPGVPCITAAKGDALQVLNAQSHALQVPMSVIGQDYQAVPDVNGFRLLHPGGDAHYDLALEGAHQIENAALVVAAVEALRASGHLIPATALHGALAEATMPGRMERRFHAGAEWLLDGAHNLDGASALRYHLGQIGWSGFHLIVGFQGDKDWVPMLQQWAPLAAHIWGVPLRSPRTLEPNAMAGAIDIIPFDACTDAVDAMQRARDAGAKHILVAGSLWLVGEVRALLDGESLEDVRGSQ